MKSKDIFALVVRVIGLAFLYQGLTAVPNMITSLTTAFPHFFLRNLFPAVLIIGWPLLIGYWLIRGAPYLMRLAYREQAEETAANPGIISDRGTREP